MTFVLGMDVGYSNLKIKMGTCEEDSSKILVPVGAGPASQMPTQMGAGRFEPIHVSLDGEPWVAGVPVDMLESWGRELHDDYPKSDQYRALFYAALLQTGRSKIDRLITGLPVSQFQDFNRRDSLKELLQGSHKVTGNRTVTVDEVVVVPQPAGAYFDLVSKGFDVEFLEDARIVVFDPGFFSVDWVVMQGAGIRKGSSGTSQQAMSKLFEEACRLIIDEYGERACTLEKLEGAVRNQRDKVMIFGEQIAIRPFLDKAKSVVGAQAIMAMKKNMRDDQGVDVVLLTGGGATFYEEAVRDAFPKSKIVISEEPAMANAEGFWFYGQ